MNSITCKVCGREFYTFKNDKYEVVIHQAFGPDMIGEAFDCPSCGCQHVVNKKYPAAKDITIIAMRSN